MLKVKPYKYQSQGIHYILKHEYVLLGDEQGLGKTLQAAAVASKTGLNTLVVCPAFLRDNWVLELSELAGLKATAVASAKDLGKHRSKIFIVSYNLFIKLQLRKTFRIIIFDEVQYLKNWSSKRTKAAHKWIETCKPKYCIMLSGTPIKNHVVEFYSLLKILSVCPSGRNGIPLREKTEFAFGMKFSTPDLNKANVWRGVRNVDKLKGYLKGKYLRRLAKDQLDLPELRFKDVQASVFDVGLDRNLSDAFKMWQTKSVKEDRDHISKIKLDAAMIKVPFTVDYIKSIVSQGQQVLVYTDHVPPAESIWQYLRESGIVSGIITGKVPDRKRQKYIKAFKTAKIKVMVCTYGAASTGLTLTNCNQMVLNDYPWVPADVDQAVKRIHRIGQKKKSLIHSIFFGDFDKVIQRKIREKIRLIRKIL